jgi:mannitol-1-phosphate/altronate dehydrogenase
MINKEKFLLLDYSSKYKYIKGIILSVDTVINTRISILKRLLKSIEKPLIKLLSFIINELGLQLESFHNEQSWDLRNSMDKVKKLKNLISELESQEKLEAEEILNQI